MEIINVNKPSFYKSKVEDLAIFGGPSSFSDSLYVGRPNIGDRGKLLERINSVLDSRWLTNNGPLVNEFEKKLSEYLGVKYCIAVCNATIGLELAIRALEMQGEVIIPSFTFIATAHALWWQGITPVFCDVDPKTHNIDPARIERLITPRTTGIIGVHLWGRPCDIHVITEIAREHSLKLLFDAAHAFGSSFQGRMIGNFGDAEVFSFHATKYFNTFEGGAIATNDKALAEKIRLMKNFGFAGYDNVVSVGTNGKMSEISAAMGLTGLESLDELIKVNYKNYQRYRNGLKNIPGITIIEHDVDDARNYQYIILEVDKAQAGISRDELIELLHFENVIARRYFYPGCHKMEPYASFFPNAGLLLPETERLALRVFSLPTGTVVEEAEIDTICDLIRYVVENSSEVTARLRQNISLPDIQENPAYSFDETEQILIEK
jgi:dTDP-4-amino-4,6-dideoxygalactose transaminase